MEPVDPYTLKHYLDQLHKSLAVAFANLEMEIRTLQQATIESGALTQERLDQIRTESQKALSGFRYRYEFALADPNRVL